MLSSFILSLKPGSISRFLFPRLYYKIKTTGNRGAQTLARSLSAVNMRAVESCTPPPTTSRWGLARAARRGQRCRSRWRFWSMTSLTGTWAFPHWRQAVHLWFPWLREEVRHRFVSVPAQVWHVISNSTCDRGYWWFQGTDWRVTHAHTRGRSHTDAKSWTAASPSKHLETFRSTRGLTRVRGGTGAAEKGISLGSC